MANENEIKQAAETKVEEKKLSPVGERKLALTNEYIDLVKKLKDAQALAARLVDRINYLSGAYDELCKIEPDQKQETK